MSEPRRRTHDQCMVREPSHESAPRVAAPPDWWANPLWRETLIEANRQYPREIVGVYCLHEDASVKLHVLPSIATSYAVSAQHQAVVDWAYQCSTLVLATVHSHPTGDSRFSRKDEETFHLWAPLHLVLYRTTNQWKTIWYHHSGAKRHSSVPTGISYPFTIL